MRWPERIWCALRGHDRRGLAEKRGRVKNDALLGSFDIVMATPLGRAVNEEG